MIKIKALNEAGSSEDEYDSSISNQQLYNIETQEENLQAIYTQYLELFSKSQVDDAKECLLKLFNLIKDLDDDQASPVQKNLKYLTFKNLGDLFDDKIDFYIEALSIDNTDINLWIKTAKRAFHKFDDFILARNCLEYAFKLNSKNWLIIDLLIDCYFILFDFNNCICLCEHALRLDVSYTKSHILLNEIRKKSKLISDVKIINKQLIDQDKHKLILKRLEDKRRKRQENIEVDRLRKAEIEKNNSLELKINLQADTLNQFGINLIKLYSDLKAKELPIDTKVNVVKINEELSNQATTNSLPSNEESNDDKSNQAIITTTTTTATLNNTNQNSLSKDGFSNSQNKLSQTNSQNNSSFPFEYVDKRRSSRVQNIQNKNTKDLDDSALLERITLLFNELCSNFDLNVKNKRLSKKDELQSQNNKSKQLVDNVNEQECFNQFIKQLDQLAKATVLNIFQLFLYFNSTELKHLALPTIYKDIYAIYRHHNPLPASSLAFLDCNQIETQELWSILIANEIKFNIREVFFLTELLVYLETNLDEQQFFTFLIKLFILRGISETNLEFLEFAKCKLEKLKEPIFNVNNEEITIQLIKALISSQSINNLQRLFKEQKYDELFELLTPELQLSDNDLKIICKSIVESKNYAKGIEIFASRENLSTICFDTLLVCYKKVSNYEINDKLIKKILHIAKTQCTVQSWSILLSILIAAPESKVKEKQILKYIELSHQYLGNKSRCNAHSGEYLLLVLDYLINVCKEEDSSDLILRCFFCLFGYTKKNHSSSFKQHCNTNVKMTFENCLLIYNYNQPEDLPEFDTANKSNSLSSETRDLYLQIVDLIPTTYHPKNFIEMLDDYLINGKPLTQTRNFQPHQITQDIFYLIADYYFKNKEFDKATQFYRLDVCTSHHRFDSWAAIALILTSTIEEQILNDTSAYYDADSIYEKSVQIIRCFSNALRLEKANTKIWIEFGNFVYNIGSYTSKMKKTTLYFDLYQQEKPKTSVEELDKRIEEMFQHAEYCFKSSLKTECDEEIWLNYYVLGKIAEKHSVLKALHYYDLADKHLYLNGACYPDKINYYNPKYLSVEALEVHYRIHACALKSLLSGKKLKIKALSKIKIYLLSALRSPFVKRSEKDKNATEYHFDKNEHTEGIFNFLSDTIDLTIERVENRESEIKMTIINLCIFGLKRCLIRFQNHYRSYYRLAHYYFVIGNFQNARSVLLDCFDDVDILTASKTAIPGLFNDRKSNNFFNGIWRIPVDDVERPGSFSNHMYKCVLLLIQVCTGQGDYNFLISNLVINLHRTPDANKKYLRDCERLGLTKKAFDNARKY